MMNKAGVCCALLVGLTLMGCGGSNRAKTFKVTGKVIMDDKPVPGASITYSPTTAKTPVAVATSDDQGNYTLTTYDSGDGAAPGEYKVMVYKTNPATVAASNSPAHDPTGASGKSSMPVHSAPKKPAANQLTIPERYSKLASTPLTRTVLEQVNDIDLEVESK